MSDAVDQSLVEAVKASDAVAVARALADGADPNAAVDRFGRSAIIEAAHRGRLDVVGVLVDAGACVGPVGHFQVSPLRVAMLEAHTGVVEYLIAHGALAAESATRRAC